MTELPRIISIAFAIFSVLFSFSAPCEEKAQEIPRIIATGVSDVIEQDIVKSKAAALKNAIVSGLLAWIYENYEEKSLIETSAMLLEKVLNQPEAFVKGYRILLERAISGRMYLVTSLEPSLGAISDLASSLGLIQKVKAVAKPQQRERVLLMVSFLRRGGIFYWWRPDLATTSPLDLELALKKALEAKGFEVVLRGIPPEGDEDLAPFNPIMDEATARAWAAANKVPIVLGGVCDLTGENTLTLDLWMVDAKTTAPILRVNKRLEGPNLPHSSVDETALRLTTIFSQALEEIPPMEKVAIAPGPTYSPPEMKEMEIELVITGYKDMSQLARVISLLISEKILEDSPQPSTMGPSQVGFHIRYKGDAKALFHALKSLKDWPYEMDMKASGENKLELIFSNREQL